MHHSDPSPDPAYHFGTDPDPVYHFDTGPDPAYHFDGDLDADPNPTFQFDADPDPQHCLQVHMYRTQTEALKISGFVQADNAPTCGVAEWVHSLAAQLSQAPQLAAYHQILSTDHELRYHL
jgi:hypothetical protein